MVKTRIRGSVIEIWPKKAISEHDREDNYFIVPEEYENAEIIQIEHAYGDYFMVEVVRRPIVPDKEDN